MHDNSLPEVSIEHLADGVHERCYWCKKPFVFQKGLALMVRYQGLDGNFYCSDMHASSPYLTRREARL